MAREHIYTYRYTCDFCGYQSTVSGKEYPDTWMVVEVHNKQHFGTEVLTKSFCKKCSTAIKAKVIELMQFEQKQGGSEHSIAP